MILKKFFCGTVLTCCLLSCCSETTYAVLYEVRVSDELIIRKGPSMYSEFLGSLKNGTIVDVVEVRGDWGRILYDGQDAWICLKFTEVLASQTKPSCVPQDRPKEYVVRVDDVLNLRAEPTTSSKVLTMISNAVVLEVEKTYCEWGRVTYNGMSGWVCMRYLEEKKDQSTYDADGTARPVNIGTSIITQEYQEKVHNGIDIGSYGGRKIDVFAVKEGTIIESVQNGNYNGGMGNFICIRHDNGYVSKYFHLDSVCVRPDSKVFTGQKIGVMGTTGDSTGVHLHLQIEKDGEPVNPKLFVSNVC